MARYIDSEKAIEKCDKLLDNAFSCPNPEVLEGVELVKNLILSECETGVETADVQVVKHGKWIYKLTYYDADECYCSECGQRMTTHT